MDPHRKALSWWNMQMELKMLGGQPDTICSAKIKWVSFSMLFSVSFTGSNL